MTFVVQMLPIVNLLAVGLTVGEAVALLLGSLGRRRLAWATRRNRTVALADVTLSALTMSAWASPARASWPLVALATVLCLVQVFKAIEGGPRRYAITRPLRATNAARALLWATVVFLALGLHFARLRPPLDRSVPTPTETVDAGASVPSITAARSGNQGS